MLSEQTLWRLPQSDDVADCRADPGLMHSLVDAEAEMCQRLDHLKQVSDDDAASLKDLERKLEAVGRALEFLDQEIPGPDVEVFGLPEVHVD